MRRFSTDSTPIPLESLFREVRAAGIPLGVEELEAALRAVQLGLAGETVEELWQLLRMLWLTSRTELDIFDPIFWTWLDQAGPRMRGEHSRAKSMPVRPAAMGRSATVSRGIDAPKAEEIMSEEATPEEMVAGEGEPDTSGEQAQVALQPGRSETNVPRRKRIIRQHDPISPVDARRAWQRLDVEEEIRTRFDLNLPKTVQRIARQGYFDAPVLQPRQFRSLNLILLMDRGGSMAPTHDFCDRWRRSLEQGVRFRRIRTAYFHDTIREDVFLDAHRNRPIPLHRLLRPFPPRQTAVLIVTDAGAARGNTNTRRVLAHRKLAARLGRSHFIQLWLNPFRPAYWERNVAAQIARIVPKMLPMDVEGTRKAIRYLNQQLNKMES